MEHTAGTRVQAIYRHGNHAFGQPRVEGPTGTVLAGPHPMGSVWVELDAPWTGWRGEMTPHRTQAFFREQVAPI